jgi:hypothetical protein
MTRHPCYKVQAGFNQYPGPGANGRGYVRVGEVIRCKEGAGGDRRFCLISPADRRASRCQILCFKDAESEASDLHQRLGAYLLDYGLPNLVRHLGWGSLGLIDLHRWPSNTWTFLVPRSLILISVWPLLAAFRAVWWGDFR